jgi:DNA-binding HxlR family transcriptional regulator
VDQPQDGAKELARLLRDELWLRMLQANIPPKKIAALTKTTRRNGHGQVSKRWVNIRLKQLCEAKGIDRESLGHYSGTKNYSATQAD